MAGNARTRWTVAVLVVAGCGAEYDVAPVSGRVTLDGQPLAGASVSFQPIVEQGTDSLVGLGSYGKTDGDGRFHLTLIDTDAAGAAVGRHRVQISFTEGDPNSDSGGVIDHVPLRYRGVDTPLSFTVPEEGSEQANFELTTKP